MTEISTSRFKQNPARIRQRKIVNGFMLNLTGFLTILALIPLFWIIGYVFIKGVRAINLDFFIHNPTPLGIPGGGISSAIQGTAILMLLATFFSVPIGIMAGLYASRYPNKPLGVVVRFSTDVLSGMPSIVVGMFIYALVVIPMGHYSGLAGGIALAVIMLPTIIRTTEEMLKLVPQTMRESSLSLGASEWKTSIRVLLPAAASGILTGFLLALARAAGETAPLLMTSLGNERFDIGLIIQSGFQGHQSIFNTFGRIINQPMDSLPLTLWKYAQQPYPERVEQSWGVALILLMLVLMINVSARLWVQWRNKKLYS
jgi:phosphate transport system permease protein